MGCQKDDFENLLSFKMDGVQYVCNSNIYYNESNFKGYPILDLYGELDFNPDGLHVEYIQITLDPFDENMSEYPMNNGNSIYMYLQKGDGIAYLAYPGNGKVIIEEISDSRIKGTFECIASPLGSSTGSGKIMITEGKFNFKRE
jgi:hypothetical protein